MCLYVSSVVLRLNAWTTVFFKNSLIKLLVVYFMTEKSFGKFPLFVFWAWKLHSRMNKRVSPAYESFPLPDDARTEDSICSPASEICFTLLLSMLRTLLHSLHSLHSTITNHQTHRSTQTTTTNGTNVRVALVVFIHQHL